MSIPSSDLLLYVDLTTLTRLYSPGDTSSRRASVRLTWCNQTTGGRHVYPQIQGLIA